MSARCEVDLAGADVGPEHVGHQPVKAGPVEVPLRLGDRVEELERLGGLAGLEVDVGEVAGVADQAGVGGRGAGVLPGLERRVEGRRSPWLARRRPPRSCPGRGGRLFSQWEPPALVCASIHCVDFGADRLVGRDRLVVAAGAVVDLAQGHPGGVALLDLGEGLGGVLGQLDQVVEVGRRGRSRCRCCTRRPSEAMPISAALGERPPCG